MSPKRKTLRVKAYRVSTGYDSHTQTGAMFLFAELGDAIACLDYSLRAKGDTLHISLIELFTRHTKDMLGKPFALWSP